MSAAAARYADYGRLFRVERAGRSRLFWGVGRARGARAMFLDKLGPRETREAMQAALDAWAARRGLRALREGAETAGAEKGTPGPRRPAFSREPEQEVFA